MKTATVSIQADGLSCEIVIDERLAREYAQLLISLHPASAPKPALTKEQIEHIKRLYEGLPKAVKRVNEAVNQTTQPELRSVALGNFSEAYRAMVEAQRERAVGDAQSAHASARTHSGWLDGRDARRPAAEDERHLTGSCPIAHRARNAAKWLMLHASVTDGRP